MSWQGTVHWGTTLDLLIGSLPGTVVGIFLISFLLERLGDAFNDWLKLVICLILVGSVLATQFARRRESALTNSEPKSGRGYGGIVAGALCGVVIGGTSVGGGSLLVVVMLMLYDIAPAKIVGSSIVVSFVNLSPGCQEAPANQHDHVITSDEGVETVLVHLPIEAPQQFHPCSQSFSTRANGTGSSAARAVGEI